MNKISIIFTGAFLGVSYLIYKMLNKRTQDYYQKEINKLQFKINTLENKNKNNDIYQTEIKSLRLQIIELKKKIKQLCEWEADLPEKVDDNKDYSYISEYINLADYLKEQELLPNNTLYEYIQNNNLYYSYEKNTWFIKDNDENFNEANLDIEIQINKSKKLTERIKKLKTIQNNPHLINIWNNI